MTFDINDGSRPSKLELARRATGEVEGEVPADFQQALDEAKAKVAPFDWEILSKQAARLEEEAERKEQARSGALRRPWLRSLIPILAAALAIIVIAPMGAKNTTRTKGGAFLIPDVSYHVMRGDEVYAGDRMQTLRQGDRVQFTIDPAGHTGLVLLSIDGNAKLSVYYPVSGQTPLEVNPKRPQQLPQSIELDDAPGPEVFVAFFDVGSVEEARKLAFEAHAKDGVEGLRDLARERDDIEVTVVEKE